MALGAKMAPFSFTAKMPPHACLERAKQLQKEGLSHLCFIDHLPHPLPLLHALDTVFDNSKGPRPQLVFHLFGDFTLYSEKWWNSLDFLKKFPCKFLVPSQRQKDLIETFIHDSAQRVFKLPFPLHKETYFFNPSLRENMREEMGIDQKTTVFIYSGRLSLQKRVIPLVKAFLMAQKKHDLKQSFFSEEALTLWGFLFWDTMNHPIPTPTASTTS